MPWLIILFGIILIIVNTKAINRDKNSFGSVLKYKEEDINDVNLEIGQLRKDFAETILELQKEIIELRGIVEKNNKSKEKIDRVIEKEPKTIETSEIKKLYNDDVINNINVNSKTESIKRLIDDGLSDQEICEKLSLGKGEVLLVRGLYKK